jgi:hypothetical protein
MRARHSTGHGATAARGPTRRRARSRAAWSGLGAGSALLAGASPAWADYFWAVAAGERRYVATEDRDYRAERSALTQCIEGFDPLLCEVAELRQTRDGWQAVVIGRRGFFGADGDRQAKADRQALSACQADRQLQNCRIAEQTRSGQGDPSQPQQRDDGSQPQLRLEDLFKR